MPDVARPPFHSERPWLVETVAQPVISQDSDLPGYDQKVPDLSRRAELSKCFRNGKDRVDPAVVPDVVRLHGRKGRDFPDGFKVYDGILLVTGVVKAVIEGLDPGRHQFVPIHVTEEDGTPIEKDWHILVVTHRQDTLVPEASSDLRWNEPVHQVPGYYNYIHPEDIALDLARLDGSHLWRERQLQGGRTLFMSHALRTALKDRGLRVLRQHRTRKHP